MHRQTIAVPGDSLATYALLKLVPALSQRSPAAVHVAIAVDVSRSMLDDDGTGSSRLDRVRAAIASGLTRLRGTDRVAIVAFSGEALMLLPSTPVAEARRIVEALDRLAIVDGGAGESALHEGIRMARREASTGGGTKCAHAFVAAAGPVGDRENCRQQASLAGAYVIGLAFAFGWTPCVGPILATVLAVAANEGSLGTGVRLLAVYSLGLGVPFILAAVAIGPFMRFLQRFKRHLGAVERAMGAMLVLAGLLILAGPVHDMLRAAMPGVVRSLAPLGTPLTLIGIALTLGLGTWLARYFGRASAGAERTGLLSGVAAMAIGLFIAGGSMNVIGQWMLDTFPVLASLEEMMTSRSLQGEILRKGAGN